MDGPLPDGIYFFQQDRSPIHMAKSIACLFEQLGVMLMECPPQGTDMNICENVWGAMKKALSRRPIERGWQYEMWVAIQEEWESRWLTDFATDLFDSLPRRMAAVVAAGSDFTKY
nr:uncharacterized protein LOC126530900 [Dermacentor andersoni]